MISTKTVALSCCFPPFAFLSWIPQLLTSIHHQSFDNSVILSQKIYMIFIKTIVNEFQARTVLGKTLSWKFSLAGRMNELAALQSSRSSKDFIRTSSCHMLYLSCHVSIFLISIFSLDSQDPASHHASGQADPASWAPLSFSTKLVSIPKSGEVRSDANRGHGRATSVPK